MSSRPDQGPGAGERDGSAKAAPSQLVLDLPHRQALGAEDFFVGPSNALAVELVDAWPKWPHAAAVVVGPKGSGKTHLAHVWQLRSGAQLLSAADLHEDNVPNPEVRQALVIEDIDRGFGDERALFHILNLARESQFSVLMTAVRPPGELQITLPDLRSRLRAVPVVSIDMPDQTLLKAVLVKLFEDRQLLVEPHVVSYLTARMERSLEAANRLVEAIDGLALAQKRPITRAVASQALKGLGDGED